MTKVSLIDGRLEECRGCEYEENDKQNGFCATCTRIGNHYADEYRPRVVES